MMVNISSSEPKFRVIINIIINPRTIIQQDEKSRRTSISKTIWPHSELSFHCTVRLESCIFAILDLYAKSRSHYWLLPTASVLLA